MTEERKHSIDKLFHESLNGQQIEPSASVWASLSSNVPEGRGQSVYLYLVAAILIGAFSFIVNISLAPFNETPLTSDIETPTAPKQERVVDEDNTVAEETNVPSEPSQESPVSDATTDQTSVSAIASTTKPKDISVPLINDSNESPLADKQEARKETQLSEDPSFEHHRLDLLDYRIASLELDNYQQLQDDEARESPKPIFDLSIKDGYLRKADILFGAAFSPAVNIYPDGQNRNDYSLDFVAAYEKSRFILEGGIGGNYTTESAKYGVTYSSYDSVGYYVNVSSFSVDPQNPDSVRFETSMKNIYDSINHYIIKENTNKYAYLQIPVRIGYRVLEKDRFSVDLKLGILFSLQIYKDVPDIPYEGNDVDQIDVIRHYPDRLTTNWQYTASLGMNYHLSRKTRLILEPFYRQYLKSVYTSGSEYSARSPYAFGIRGGIYFHF